MVINKPHSRRYNETPFIECRISTIIALFNFALSVLNQNFTLIFVEYLHELLKNLPLVTNLITDLESVRPN